MTARGKTLLIATRNRKKKAELKQLLRGAGARIVTLDEIPAKIPPVVETGKTFRQNAVKKAVQVSRRADGCVIADDSGLMVNVLGGRPGVRSARFARDGATDTENNAKLLRLLKNVPPAKRGAVFVAVIAIARGGKLLGVAEGRCRGRIKDAPRGRKGFGYDPLFVPQGSRRTFAEMKKALKNRISHRARALRRARKLIGRYL